VSQFPKLESRYHKERKDAPEKTSTNNISQFAIKAGLSTEEQGSYKRVLLYATARIRTAETVHTLECPTTGSDGSCDWPPQCFSAFFVTANAELAPTIHDVKHSSYARLPTLTSKFPPKHSSPHVIKISAQCSPPNTTCPNVPLLSSVAHFNNLLYNTLPPSLLCLESSLFLPEGRAGIAWENSGK
jgi:hypothetical protein